MEHVPAGRSRLPVLGRDRPDLALAEAFTLLHFSKRFLGDYILTVIIAAHFIGFRRIAPRFAGLLELGARPIRTASSLTFSLYLFHLPLLLLVILLLRGMQPGPAYFLAALGITLALVVPLGIVTERQKDVLKRWLGRGGSSSRIIRRTSS